MFNNSLDKCVIISKSNGDELVDLIGIKYDFKNFKFGTKGTRVYVLPASFAMRPDLISYTYYGDLEKIDLILKYNNISNPFSIMENDTISLPDFSYTPTVTITETVTDTNTPYLAGQKYLNPDKPTLPSEIERIIPSELLEPIFPTEETVTYKDGRAYIGNSVAPSCVSDGVLQSELITNITKNSIII